MSGASNAARAVRPDGAPGPEPWPQGISRRASMRISDVLGDLRPEFPGVSHSKLRFLEEQGLIEPVRTTSGYRQYSPADVERLRYVLTQQRDSYLPLKVIKERLVELDSGILDAAPGPRPATADGERETAQERYTLEALCAATGADPAMVSGLVEAGVVAPTSSGRYDAFAVELVTVAAALAEHGIQARHLRSLRTASDRHLGLVQQVVAPWRGQQSPSSRAHAATVAAEVGELCARLHTTWVRQGIADIGS
ncbi:MerR family transcriptional regulator [Cellulomonas sp. PhB143]|uniref:transcriptional regulator FtsR n=1 Tax=Cellulomonas sp. PhB143 TaxID=2485186 RepID=UPI000FBFA11B|nr:MerR family transcriptional regulator [Cellulomonas sp. PhB143]ROS74504.1 MerR-like DNA binding protein [Cellulomonas sp. PhB143]